MGSEGNFVLYFIGMKMVDARDQISFYFIYDTIKIGHITPNNLRKYL